MIDRRCRDDFALSLRRLVIGRLSTREFDRRLGAPLISSDRGLAAVAEVAETLYPEFGTYWFRGPRTLKRSAVRHIARWILFLKGPWEYEWETWPKFKGTKPVGDSQYWPFVRRSDLEDALRKPPYLVGKRGKEAPEISSHREWDVPFELPFSLLEARWPFRLAAGVLGIALSGAFAGFLVDAVAKAVTGAEVNWFPVLVLAVSALPVGLIMLTIASKARYLGRGA